MDRGERRRGSVKRRSDLGELYQKHSVGCGVKERQIAIRSFQHKKKGAGGKSPWHRNLKEKSNRRFDQAT